MHITLNGEARKFGNDITLEELVALLKLTGKRIAVEVNGEIVPRSQYRLHQLEDADRVEIVQAIGGG
ncbi:MAG: sulfur carrier protein ThiS [Gammaproteobacteria bacterium]|nr:sulfur carrier protein ThiS [Gammaproteobacteria bacterium]